METTFIPVPRTNTLKTFELNLILSKIRWRYACLSSAFWRCHYEDVRKLMLVFNSSHHYVYIKSKNIFHAKEGYITLFKLQ